MSGADDERDGVPLSNLDHELFDGAGTTKRHLVDYLDVVSDAILPALRDRPLSVVRIRPGQPAFMQKNLPSYAPKWVQTVSVWAEASKRQVSYALCNDRKTLLWFANQRAVEYHVTLFRVPDWESPTHLVMDLDPPEGAEFSVVVRAAQLVRQALTDSGLAGAVKTSGAKGVHVCAAGTADGTRGRCSSDPRIAARAERLDPALATTAFVKENREGKVFSTPHGPAGRPSWRRTVRGSGRTCRCPSRWPGMTWTAFRPPTSPSTAPGLLGHRDPWVEQMPAPQRLDADLVAEGHSIPIARVQAMHEGKRRARARREC